MTLHQTWAPPEDLPTIRIPVVRPGPRTWAEAAERSRSRRRHARQAGFLWVLVVLAALTAGGVLWQLIDGAPLDMIRGAEDVVLRPAVEGLRRLFGQL